MHLRRMWSAAWGALMPVLVPVSRNGALMAAALFLGAVTAVAQSNDQPGLAPSMTIFGQFKGRAVMVTATHRSAGAIESLQWGGIEFIDANDHGRDLQSAVSFDGLTECDNPTEAGASRDGPGASSSLLLRASASDNILRTQSQMAYWLRPGQRSPGCGKARNDLTTKLSSTRLTKSVRFLPNYANVLEHRISFDLARPRAQAQFEVLTAYMPAHFDTFYRFDPASGRMEPLSDGPGEQEQPVVLATSDGEDALGLFTPQAGGAGLKGPGYGRWRFVGERVTKANVVFRQENASAGAHAFLVYSVFGSLEDVRNSLIKLYRDTRTQVAQGAPEPFAAEPEIDLLARN
jgi:hypothetical protein